MPFKLIRDDVFAGLRRLKDGSVHTIVTSPPYWPLRDYGHEQQMGSEKLPETYVANVAAVFKAAASKLHATGTVWLNIGDTWASPRNHENLPESERPENAGLVAGFRSGRHLKRPLAPSKIFDGTIKAKDMTCLPWRVAMAIQAHGFYLRAAVIWYKRNAMPGAYDDRPTHAYDYVFLFSKSEHYFYDKLAVTTEQVLTPGAKPLRDVWVLPTDDVWDIPIKGFDGAHFATFPLALPERCIRLGTSAAGCCPVCGDPATRVVERTRTATRPAVVSKTAGLTRQVVGARDRARHTTEWRTMGWRRGCRHCLNEHPPVQCLVLDPFVGSGTTCLAAENLGRRSVGIDLNMDYLKMANKRIMENRKCPVPDTIGV